MVNGLAVGDRVKTLRAEIDDNDGEERTTPVGTFGEVVSLDDYPAQGRTYGVGFESGAFLFYLESELDTLEKA